jgi:hypothetical protein
MIIINAKHFKDETDTNIGIKATINGEELLVPYDEANRHYAEILKWVADGNTIEEAD